MTSSGKWALILCDFTLIHITCTYLSSAFALEDPMTSAVIIRSYQIQFVENWANNPNSPLQSRWFHLLLNVCNLKLANIAKTILFLHPSNLNIISDHFIYHQVNSSLGTMQKNMIRDAMFCRGSPLHLMGIWVLYYARGKMMIPQKRSTACKLEYLTSILPARKWDQPSWWRICYGKHQKVQIETIST